MSKWWNKRFFDVRTFQVIDAYPNGWTDFKSDTGLTEDTFKEVFDAFFLTCKKNYVKFTTKDNFQDNLLNLLQVNWRQYDFLNEIFNKKLDDVVNNVDDIRQFKTADEPDQVDLSKYQTGEQISNTANVIFEKVDIIKDQINPITWFVNKLINGLLTPFIPEIISNVEEEVI